jgi:hypothetical protein
LNWPPIDAEYQRLSAASLFSGASIRDATIAVEGPRAWWEERLGKGKGRLKAGGSQD